MKKIAHEYEYEQGNYAAFFAQRVLCRLKTPVKAIAYNMNVPESTFYKWRQAVRVFPAELAPVLYGAVEHADDKQLIRDFHEFDGFMFIPVPNIEGVANGSISREEVRDCLDFMMEKSINSVISISKNSESTTEFCKRIKISLWDIAREALACGRRVEIKLSEKEKD